MKSLKRVIAMMMSVLMLVMVVPLSDAGVQAANISASEFQTRLASVKSRFKDGEYFSGNYGTGANLTKTSSKLLCTGTNSLGTTCSNKGYCAGGGWCSCSCGTYYYGGSARTYQCWAFACQVGYDIFGIDSYGGWQTHRNANNIQPGDIIRFSWNTGYAPHSIFVTNVVGDTIYYADANYTGPCKVEWDHSKTRSQIAALLNNRTDSEFRIYHAPNNATTTSTAPSVSYATITTGKYYIKNTSTGTYLNVDGGTDANTQNVSVASFTGGTSMQMEITSATSGYKIRPLCSSSRLVNPYADYVSSGVNVNIYNNVNDSSQWWGFEKVSGGYVIRNMQNQNCVLALSGSNVIVSTYTGAANQVWALEPYDTYTISYNANGGSGAPSSQTKVHGISVKLSSTKPTRTGYKFLGWSTSSSATSATYASGATYSSNGNVTLYAVWEANTYTVTYYANGGISASAPSAQTKIGGENLVLSTQIPRCTGYVFAGWATSETATSAEYQPGDIYTKNESIKLYAIWRDDSFTTYFKFNDSYDDGSYYISFRQSGEPIVFPETNPHRSFHYFLGWSDSRSATVAQYKAGESINVADGDRTFYTVWRGPENMEVGVDHNIILDENCKEKYYTFAVEETGFYKLSIQYANSNEDSQGYVSVYDYDRVYDPELKGVASTSYSQSTFIWVEKGETYYLECSLYSGYEEGNYIVNINPTDITHMEVTATKTVYETSLLWRDFDDFEPTISIYGKNKLYFQGKREELYQQLGIRVDDNMAEIEKWEANTYGVNVSIGELSCMMDIVVEKAPIVSVEPVGKQVLIEKVDGSYVIDEWSGEEWFEYEYNTWDFVYVVTYETGETEKIDYYTNDLYVWKQQSIDNAWGVGVHTVYGEYLGHPIEFKVEVVANPVESLEIVSEPIIIEENTYISYGESASGYEDFTYSVSSMLKDYPIQLQISYTDGTIEIYEINTTYSNEMWDKGIKVTTGTFGMGKNNAIGISYMGHEIQTNVQIVEGQDIDPIVSGKVIEMPERSGIYPIGTNFDINGIKVELTYASGETEVVMLERDITGAYCQLKQFGCSYRVTNKTIVEGEQVIQINLAGVTIPLATVEGTVTIVDRVFLTIPNNIWGEGAKVRYYYSDGTTQDVTLLEYIGSHGRPGDFEYGWIVTDAGFIGNGGYRVEVRDEHVQIHYSEGGACELDEINAKLMVCIVQEYFGDGISFRKKQTNKNLDAIVMTALAYHLYDTGLSQGVSLEDASDYIECVFDIRDIDLTKSSYYDTDNNLLLGDVWWNETTPIQQIFTDQFELYHDDGETWVYKCTDNDENVIYVEMIKSTNQILYIGDTYEIATPECISVIAGPQKLNYYVGDTLDISGLQLQLNYSDGTTQIITEGFTVSEFDAYQTGEQMIIFSYEGLSTTFNVSVEAPTITISSREETLEIDGTVALSAETTPNLQTVNWTSSNENVVTVTDGVVTAVASGTAVITAQFTYNGQTYSQTCVVTVNEPLPIITNITVATSPAKTTYIVGETLDTTGLWLRVDYDNGTSEIVSEGFEVTGYDASVVGIQTLEVAYADVTTNFTVTVSNPELILSDSERTMVIGGTVQLRVDTIPTGQTVTWKSADTSVATVENGLVTAVNSGKTVVSAEFVYDGKTYSKECTITVIASLTSIEIATTPNKTVYQIGGELDTTGLSLRLNYDDGTTKVVTDGFTTYGYEAEKAGTQIITVYYHGHALTYTVLVEVDENTPQIIVESKKNVAGKTVTVDVILKNNPGIASARLTLDFDTSVLTLIDVTDAGKLGVQCHKAELTSPYTLSWMNDTATEDFDYNGTIVTLTFEIAEDAELGDYIINLSYDYDNYDIWNVNVERVKFVVLDGVISVIDTIIGDVNGDGVVNTLDRMTLARYLANWEAYTAETIDLVAADVNGDGKVNTLDRMVLARHLADWSGYETLPCET